MLPERFTEDRNLEWAANGRTGIHDRVKSNLKKKKKKEAKEKTKPERKKEKEKTSQLPSPKIS